MDPEGGAWTHPAVRSTVDSGRSVSQKSEFLISIFCQCLHASCMFSNTRFVWVEINNTKPRNYGRVTASPKWYLAFSFASGIFHWNLDANTKYSANRTVQQMMVLLLGICIWYFQVLWNIDYLRFQ